MGRPPKEYSLASIAKKADVSRYVVSCVLNNRPGINDETRAKVAEIIRETGYTRTYKLSKGRTIGLVLPGNWDDWYVSALVRGVMKYSSETDVNIATILQESEGGEGLALEFRKHNCDSAVIALPTRVLPHIEEICREASIPIILSNTNLDNIRLSCSARAKLGYVDNNSRQGCYNLTKYLLDLGHRKIAFVRRGTYLSDSNNINRVNGWKAALLESGAGDREIDASIFSIHPRDIDLTGIIGNFSAIVALDDKVALACLSYCFEKGIKVPDDISVTGFGNMDISNLFCPPLTTVDQKTVEVGFLSAKYATELATGKREKLPNEVIDTELMIRKSSGPAKKQQEN